MNTNLVKEKILSKTPVYLENWTNSLDVFADFSIPVIEDIQILLASYNTPMYNINITITQ